MVAAAVGVAALVIGLLAYSAAQDEDYLEDGMVYQEVNLAELDSGGGMAATASFWVDAQPLGAVVHIDGDSVGLAPAWVTGVAGGMRHVQVWAPDGSVVADTMFWVEPGAVAELDVSPRPTSRPAGSPASPAAASPSPQAAAPSTGSLRVTSSPSGATVAVGGRRVGETPISIRGVAPGRHDLRVTRAGYESVVRSVDIRAGGVFDTDIDLRRAEGVAEQARPQPAPPEPARPARARAESDLAAPSRPAPDVAPPAVAETGEVEILVRPWGRIVIDGTVHQRESDVLYRTSLAPGVHRVVVSHPSLGTQERRVTVSPGESVRLEVDLTGGDGS